jgi:putative transposase
MSFVKIWVHSVWGTKNHERILDKDVRQKLFQHIKQNAKTKNIYVDFVNGYFDHVHCLLSLNTDLSISKALQLIKGESAFWANKNKLTKKKLEWADEYFAVSVSESMIEKVRSYIKNQEEHHKLETFSHEYKKFVKKYGFISQG